MMDVLDSPEGDRVQVLTEHRKDGYVLALAMASSGLDVPGQAIAI